MWFAPAVALNLHRLLIFDPPTHSFSSFNNLSPFSEELFGELTAKMLHDFLWIIWKVPVSGCQFSMWHFVLEY